MKKKILLVDDDPEAVELLQEVLLEAGFEVISTGDGNEAITLARDEQPDLIILDVALPGTNGFEVCRILKAEKITHSIPIIMISGKAVEIGDKVQGFGFGADDYVTKPFEVEELLARIKAILRRYKISDDFEEVIKRGDILLDVSRAEVRVKGKIVRLRPKEFDLLYLLMKKSGRVLSRSFLLESIWGHQYFGTTRTVDVHIARLRRKLGKEGKSMVKTVQGKGYVFAEEG